MIDVCWTHFVGGAFFATAVFIVFLFAAAANGTGRRSELVENDEDVEEEVEEGKEEEEEEEEKHIASPQPRLQMPQPLEKRIAPPALQSSPPLRCPQEFPPKRKNKTDEARKMVQILEKNLMDPRTGFISESGKKRLEKARLALAEVEIKEELADKSDFFSWGEERDLALAHRDLLHACSKSADSSWLSWFK